MATNLLVLVVTFLGLIVSQWYLYKDFEEKRIEKALDKAFISVENVIADRITRAEDIELTILRHPGVAAGFQILKSDGNPTLLASIVGPLLGEDVYGAVAVDIDGRRLYNSASGEGRSLERVLDYTEKLEKIAESGPVAEVVAYNDAIEYHYYQFLYEEGRQVGILDVIFYLDNQFAHKIFLQTGHHIAFLNRENRPLVISHPRLLSPVFEDGLVRINEQGFAAHYQTMIIGCESMPVILYSDVTAIKTERATLFQTSIAVVLFVVVAALFFANYLAARFSKSLELLADNTMRIAGGDFSTTFEKNSRITEIAEITTAFNAMTSTVQKAIGDLEEANRRLQDLDELKSAFLSSVSHELRTPLTSVLGFAKLIGKDFRKLFKPLVAEDSKLAKKAVRVEQNLDIIIQEGERLTRLINDVLDLAKIESGRMDYRNEVVAVKDIVDQAVQAASGQFAVKPVSLEAFVEDGLPLLEVDRDKLVQVIINLLNNAAKFTEEGSVTVKAESADDGWVQVGVADTGPGIPEEDLEKVFDKFHQVQTTDTKRDKPKGTGLGLAICHQIVTHYGGRIWVESVVGQGSVFKFLTPGLDAVRAMADKAGPEAVDESSATRPEAERPLVLVVDESERTRSVLEKIWLGEGFRVEVVGEGPAARKASERLRPDFITVVHRRPGFDGLTPALRTARDPVLRRLPLIVTMLPVRRSYVSGFRLERSETEDSAMLDSLQALILREDGAGAACLIASLDGETPPAPPMGFCAETIHCEPDKVKEIVDGGFKGRIIVGPGALLSLDLAFLAAGAEIETFFAPKRSVA